MESHLTFVESIEFRKGQSADVCLLRQYTRCRCPSMYLRFRPIPCQTTTSLQPQAHG